MIYLLVLPLLVAGTVTPDSCEAAMPLRPGWAWMYTGSALWSSHGGAHADSGAVSWTMSIVAARDAGGTRIALVRGFVAQLAWYEPATRSRLSLLACHESRLYRLEPEGDSSAQGVYAHWSDSLLQQAEVLLDLPLHDGQLFGQTPPRNDALYGWAVAAVPPGARVRLPASCGHSTQHRFELSYRSLPDHTIIEWEPGLGVTQYTYEHHGTPAATEVHLTGCRRPSS